MATSTTSDPLVEEDPSGLGAHCTGRNDANRAAVRAHGGLTVVVSEDSKGRALASLPSGMVVPYADDLEWQASATRQTDAATFGRTELDDVSELTWAVVAPDPWEAAVAWSPVGDSAVFFPERLTAPQTRVKREASDRERTVLVAPGVDLFSPVVPDRVVTDIIGAARADPRHRYLVLTKHAGRAKVKDWPPNVYVCAEAVGTAENVSAAANMLSGVTPNALVVRDLAEPIDAGVLAEVDWVLVRGSKTTQEAYDSLRAGLKPTQTLDLGRDVRARHSGYPAMAASGESRTL